MYRVVTKHRDHRNRWIVEHGPWHTSRGDASDWANILRDLGYVAELEGSHGSIGEENDNDALRDALSTMA